MKGKGYILPIGLLMMVLAGCSTQKNTWTSRVFHQTKVRYNIFYNGDVAFIEGQKAITAANEDDYTGILNLYPVSNHTAAAASASQMDVTIEKCRKSIKLHSIKAKPKPDPKKRNKPKYKAWLKQEEFNKEIARAWIRLGEAEFHKGDFLGSIGTFRYIEKHYSYDPDMVAQCQLWVARAYGELGWYYEAEDMLRKVKMDDLKRKHASLYSSVSADVLIKVGLYHEAIPFVKLALPDEKRTVYRPRFAYVLGQLYEREGKKGEAITYYRKAIRLTPPVVMDFNARLHIAQLRGKSSLKRLKSMLRQSKYKDNLDQIYGAMGNIVLAERDTVQALEYYGKAIEAATQGGMNKAEILVRAADLLYQLREYELAQPDYREAVTILPSEHKDYSRVLKLSESLDGLVKELGTITLQDSLQALSRLSEEEQRKVAERIVAELIEQEKKAEEEAKQAARNREIEDDGPLSVDTRNMLGGGAQSADWYFYNAPLIKSGKQDFQRRWGRRPLEDNWRRLSKTATASMFADNTESEEWEMDSVAMDSTQQSAPAAVAMVTDDHQPEYYLQQIPRTEKDFYLSDSLIADALYNLVYIYKDELDDRVASDATLEEMHRRFPQDRRMPDLLYMQYLTAMRDSDETGMNLISERLLSEYPDSKQAMIVRDPQYFDKLRRMAQQQDSLFEQTYNAFAANRFQEVKANKTYFEQEYPLSPLMPRFLFLNAIAVARSEGQDAFIVQLRDMVERYPENELSAMAKDFLAMMGQGMESQKGAITSNLNELRGAGGTQEEAEVAEKTFSPDTNLPSYVLVVLPEQDEALLNRLLYQVALFNFSQFLIRDFDIRQMPIFGEQSALRISGFDTMAEAQWYIGLTEQNSDLQNELQTAGVQVLPITEENFQLLNTKYTLEEYKSFLR